jgi:hypothetical protein
LRIRLRHPEGKRGLPVVPRNGAAARERRSDIISQTDFLAAVEQELQLHGVSFSRAALQEFVADVWPLAQENPDVTFWAREFIDLGRATMMA